MVNMVGGLQLPLLARGVRACSKWVVEGELQKMVCPGLRVNSLLKAGSASYSEHVSEDFPEMLSLSEHVLKPSSAQLLRDQNEPQEIHKLKEETHS
jgi:hypothetical protein